MAQSGSASALEAGADHRKVAENSNEICRLRVIEIANFAAVDTLVDTFLDVMLRWH